MDIDKLKESIISGINETDDLNLLEALDALLTRKPGLGITTSDSSVFEFEAGKLMFYYGVTKDNIVIYTISAFSNNPG